MWFRSLKKNSLHSPKQIYHQSIETLNVIIFSKFGRLVMVLQMGENREKSIPLETSSRKSGSFDSVFLVAANSKIALLVSVNEECKALAFPEYK